MSRPTAQPHLWLINGGIVDARKSSDILALQIIAQMQGLVPSLVRQPDGEGRLRHRGLTLPNDEQTQ
jgi:hypothetical protein